MVKFIGGGRSTIYKKFPKNNSSKAFECVGMQNPCTSRLWATSMHAFYDPTSRTLLLSTAPLQSRLLYSEACTPPLPAAAPLSPVAAQDFSSGPKIFERDRHERDRHAKLCSPVKLCWTLLTER
jgi:hypothetical protein